MVTVRFEFYEHYLIIGKILVIAKLCHCFEREVKGRCIFLYHIFRVKAVISGTRIKSVYRCSAKKLVLRGLHQQEISLQVLSFQKGNIFKKPNEELLEANFEEIDLRENFISFQSQKKTLLKRSDMCYAVKKIFTRTHSQSFASVNPPPFKNRHNKLEQACGS